MEVNNIISPNPIIESIPFLWYPVENFIVNTTIEDVQLVMPTYDTEFFFNVDANNKKLIRLNSIDKVAIKFRPEYECEGESLIANFYEIGKRFVSYANFIPHQSSQSIKGTTRDKNIELPLNITNLIEGASYSIVIKTNETGVVYKNLIYINECN